MSKEKETEKKSSVDMFKLGIGVVTLAAFTPAMFPTLGIPTMATMAPYISAVGVASISGFGSFLVIDAVKTIIKSKGDK